jgi:hypothetical protein
MKMTYLYLPPVPLMITYENQKHFQMAPPQQPSSQCQKIKLLCIGDQILRFHTYQKRYQTATTNGQFNPSSCTALQH